MPRRCAPLSEATDPTSGPLDDRPGRREVLGPGRRNIQAGGIENGRHIGEVVRLAVDRDLQERPLAERITEASAPAVAGQKPLDEVGSVVALARALQELVERLNEAGGQVLPNEHRPGHVDVRCTFALQQVMDLVREVEVARNDPDIERDSRLLLELHRMTLHARDVRVSIGTEEANDPHGADLRTSPGRQSVPPDPGSVAQTRSTGPAPRQIPVRTLRVAVEKPD